MSENEEVKRLQNVMELQQKQLETASQGRYGLTRQAMNMQRQIGVLQKQVMNIEESVKEMRMQMEIKMDELQPISSKNGRKSPFAATTSEINSIFSTLSDTESQLKLEVDEGEDDEADWESTIPTDYYHGNSTEDELESTIKKRSQKSRKYKREEVSIIPISMSKKGPRSLSYVSQITEIENDQSNDDNNNTESPNYTCKECTAVFKQKSKFTRHQKVHSKEKSLHCEKCEYSCNRMDSLKQHIRRIHK